MAVPVSDAATILDALRARHARERNGDTPAWIFATEVTALVGFSGLRPTDRARFEAAGLAFFGSSRIDAFALHTWPSQKYRRIAYEVKVTRSDLTRDLADRWKQATAKSLSNLFYYVLDADVTCRTDEIPDDCGLMRYSQAGLRIVKQAPWRNVPDPPLQFLLSLMRRIQMEAERTRP